MKDLNEIIEQNYKSIKARNLINENTTLQDFIDKLFEEVREVDEVVNPTCEYCDYTIEEVNRNDLIEELADVILVCLNFAKHYNLDIEKALKDKIQVNFERAMVVKNPIKE